MRGEMSAIAEGAVAPRREIADDLAQNCQRTISAFDYGEHLSGVSLDGATSFVKPLK